jgi:hypothetical protein
LHVRPDTPLTGDAASDGPLIIGAIRKGHVYTAVDGVASPPYFVFTGANGAGTAAAGDVLTVADAVTLHVQSNAPPGWTTIVHDGATTLAAAADTQDFTVHGPRKPGVFWVEIVSRVGAPPITWIRSNPVYVRGEPASVTLMNLAAATARRPLFDGKTADGWRNEHDTNSAGAVEVANTANAAPELRFRFGLAGGDPVGQVTALVRDLPTGVAGFDRLAISLRAEKPMRISVQVRDTTADRWQKSIYVDTSTQERIVALDDLIPVGITHVASPARDAIRAVMLVVDTTNTKPGTSGRIWMQKAELESLK